MKIRNLILPIFFVSILLISCNLLTNVGVRVITPSDNIISENRNVAGFNAIEFSTFGKINIIHGDTETLNISGPDNLVSEITTTVNNGTLVIKTKDNITVASLDSEKNLTFTLVVKDLTSLAISGAGDVQVEALSTPSMDLNLSGAGRVQMNQLTTDNLKIDLSGVGSLDISGSAAQASIDISGAGNVNAPDLQVQSASINISGLGGATIWVTDQLSGEISGAGSVSYYGSPQTTTSTSGLGKFKSLGSK